MKVFELFSGIGGTHCALNESGCKFEVVRALDINTTANAVYRQNFPDTHLMQNNVQSLMPKLFEDLKIDMITMSPPCQPYTRQGHQKGEEDNRNDALSHILAILPELTGVKYIFLENVVGFETSSSRQLLLSTLLTAQFRYQEFILTPTDFGVPNSRSRYYLLARRGPFSFVEVPEIRHDLPSTTDEDILRLINKFSRDECFEIEKILGEDAGDLLPDKVLLKYGFILDIVTEKSRKSCCFTKGYSHYAEGTGSVFCSKDENAIAGVYKTVGELSKDDPKYLEELKSLTLRYFSPKEVAKLLCFPDKFTFPQDVMSRQRYRLLGNSINVHVVAVLIKLLTT